MAPTLLLIRWVFDTLEAMKNKLIIGGVIIVIGLLFSWHWIFPNGSTATAMSAAPSTINPSTLEGIQQSTTTPWAPELKHLKARLSSIGLAALTAEGSVEHTHEHLDIFINGARVAVPAGIGIDQMAGYISPIHVHDNTSTIHIESPMQRDFTLGEFFDVWGVYFTKDCIGGYCADATHSLSVYVDGQPFAGSDPRMLTLKEHQEIAIVYGTASDTPATIPSSFNFPQGE